MNTIKLIVGLGNTGAQYLQTRHNAGFWLLDSLVGASAFQAQRKFFGEVAEYQTLRLLKPSTMMNLSGKSVQAVAQFYKIPLSQVLVVHDELDIAPGALRLKQGGGHGGHNGLRDIIRLCGPDFWRLRVGIGHPGHASQVVNFVLQRAPSSEQQRIDAAIDRALQNLNDIVAGRMAAAMNVLHQREKDGI